MTDPCDTCLRWPECNGVDADNCPAWATEKGGIRMTDKENMILQADRADAPDAKGVKQ